MSTVKKHDIALAKLRAEGHEIGTAVISPTGEVLVLVDGVYRTYTQIYEMADLPDE
jgi:hypothetical protein